MKLSEWAVRRRVTTSMICLAMLLLGAISFREMPLQLFPDIVYPGLGVYAGLREATPRETEEDLTIPIENAVAALPGVHEIESFSGAWGSWTNVQFDFSTDMRFTFIELNERLEVLKKSFPKERLEYHMFRWDSGEMQNRFFMELSVTGEGPPEMLRDVVLARIKQRLEEVDGVYKVEIGGHDPHQVEVNLDPNRMRHYGVPFFSIMQRIRAWSNEKVYLGKARTPDQMAYVRLADRFGESDDLEQLIIDSARRLRLREVAEVDETSTRGESLYRVDGKAGVGMRLEKEARANPLRTAARVEKVIERINRDELPPGYSVQIIQSQAEILAEVMWKIAKLALIGIVLAVIVLFIFVRNWIITLIVVVAIPLSIFGTFNLMYGADMTINILSMIGLALAVGMLVDNSIVVLENIYRNYQAGHSRFDSARRGADEVGRAILASTLTTVIAFVPIFFVHGEVRLIFREMGLSVVYPLVISLLVAVTFVPMATYYALSLQSREKRLAVLAARRTRGLFRRLYVVLLGGSLRHRGRLLAAVAFVIFFTWAFQRQQVDRGYLNRNIEESHFNLFVNLPEGTRRETTDKIVREVESILTSKEKFPEIKRFTAWVYEDSGRLGITVDPEVAGARELDQLKDVILDETENVPLAELSYTRQRTDPQMGVMQQLGETGRLQLRGPDYDVLAMVAARIEQFLLTIPGIREVDNNLSSGAPEVRLVIDREKASLLKISAQAIQQAVMAGNAAGQISEVRVHRGEEELAVVFRLEDAEERILSDLATLDVWSLDGRSFPLSEVTTFELGDSPGRIHRKNQERIAEITYTTDNVRKKIDISADIKRLAEYVAVPPGYNFSLEGEDRKIDEMLTSLTTVLLVGFALVYMVMAGLFESLFAPIVIMVTVPLALIGAIWGLRLTGNPYDAMAAMGSIFLLGIVVNNGIVFIDFVNLLRRERSYSLLRALMTAGQYRMRPIFMTSLTTVLGLLPLALKTGETNPWRPLAIVVIGGMTVSTLLTLVVLPAVHLTLVSLQRRVARTAFRVLSWRRWLYFWSGARRRRVRERFRQRFPSLALSRGDLAALPLSVQTHNLTVLYRDHWAEVRAALRQTMHRPALTTTAGIRFTGPMTPRRVQCGFYALHEVDLTLEPGMIGLLGPNGAGKTTLLRLLALLTTPTRGSVEICGLSAREHRGDLAPLVGYLPQQFGFPGNFRCGDYLRQQALWRGLDDPRQREEAVQRALVATNLLDRRRDRIRHLSGGMRQRLGIAQTLLHLPRIIIVDEPTAGLDPMERIQFRNLLAGLARERIVLFSTHIVEDIGQSCDRLLVLEEGKLIYSGSQSALLSRARGRVWEWVQPEGAPPPRGLVEVSQTLVAEGRRIRALAPAPPAPGARPAEPRLADAYFDLRRFRNRV